MLNILEKIFTRLKKLKYERAIATKSIESRFNNIYAKNLWYSNKQSRSGSGSTLEATENIRRELPEFLKEINATSLVDLGCGDFYWMKEIDIPCSYIGLDIVPGIVEENQKRYANNLREFKQHNAIEDSLPEDTDVILCREVLFHLSFAYGMEVVQRVLESNASYFIATTSEAVSNDKDIRTGQFRNVDLLKPPYNLPPYVIKWQDSDKVSSDRHLCVWEVSKMRETLSLYNEK